MAEMIDESSSLESVTIGVSRTSATIKGGRRFSFNALVVIGDRRGSVGLGYGKAKEVPAAIEKAQRDARKRLHKVRLLGGTIPHQVTGRFGASSVMLIPAPPGTGIVAGATVRGVLEMAGLTDCVTKCYGSTNPQNTVKAALHALEAVRTRQEIAALRGVTLEDTTVETMVERGSKLMPVVSAEKKMKAPVSTVAKASGRGGRGGRGGPRRSRGGGGGGGDEGGAPQQSGGEQSSSGGESGGSSGS